MCFDHYDDEYAEFYGERYVMCRKPHRCEECGRAIPSGELAMNRSGKFDGDMFSLYVCGACELTRYQIHLHEIEEGCKGDETWCPNGELLQYCHDTSFPRAEKLAGQEFLATKRDEQQAQAAEWRKQRKLSVK